MRPDAEDGLADRPVSRDQRADRILVHREPERGQLASDVVERLPVFGRVCVAADRLVAHRVGTAREGRDVASDSLRAQCPVDRSWVCRHPPELYYRCMDDVWPPPEAQARAALWAAERHLLVGEYLAAADALDGALEFGSPTTVRVARALRQLATAGYRGQCGDAARASRLLGRARSQLALFLPSYDEVDLVALLAVVTVALET